MNEVDIDLNRMSLTYKISAVHKDTGIKTIYTLKDTNLTCGDVQRSVSALENSGFYNSVTVSVTGTIYRYTAISE